MLEGADGARAVTVRTRGEPHTLFSVIVSAEWMIGDPHALPQRFDLDGQLETLARDAMRSFDDKRPATESAAACHRVVRRLAALGFVDPAIEATFTPPDPGDARVPVK